MSDRPRVTAAEYLQWVEWRAEQFIMQLNDATADELPAGCRLAWSSEPPMTRLGAM